MGRTRRALLAAGALILAAGCVGEEPAAKGTEEGSPEDGKLDSFAAPTEHGQLRFGVPSDAVFAEGEAFHAWTFSVTDAADVELTTLLGTANVDTVMYLYGPRGEDGSWGRYSARNDDADGTTLASRIVAQLGAGEYKVLVKPHKMMIRGSFQVLASCAGPGCEAGDVACDPEADVPLPASSSFTAACARRIRAVVDAGVTSSSTYGIAPERRCTVAELEGLSVAYYQAYWDDLMGWEDFVSDSDEEVELEVEVYSLDGRLSGGTLVGVDIGGDETAMDFLYDLDGELVMLYQHNQSPDMRWFCGGEGEPEVDEPGDTCLATYLRGMLHAEDAVTGEEHRGTIAELSESLGGLTAVALHTYAESRGLEPTAAVQVELLSWESADWGRGGQVRVSSEGQPTMVYDTIGEEGYSLYVATETNEATGDVRFVCAEP